MSQTARSVTESIEVLSQSTSAVADLLTERLQRLEVMIVALKGRFEFAFVPNGSDIGLKLTRQVGTKPATWSLYVIERVIRRKPRYVRNYILDPTQPISNDPADYIDVEEWESTPLRDASIAKKSRAASILPEFLSQMANEHLVRSSLLQRGHAALDTVEQQIKSLEEGGR